jgi:hypothetical protein
MSLEILIWPGGVEESRRYIDSASFRRHSKLTVGLNLDVSCKPKHYERNERKEKQNQGDQINFMLE